MIFTFFVVMCILTFAFFNLAILVNWDNKKGSVPAMVYAILFCWQMVSGAFGAISAVNRVGVEFAYGNFTQTELIMSGVAILIGIVTTTIIFFDFRWYLPIIAAKRELKTQWAETFPKPEKVKVLETTEQFKSTKLTSQSNLRKNRLL